MGETVKIPVGTSLREGYIFYSIYTADRLVETRLLKLSNRCKTLSVKFDKPFGGVATISLLTVRDGEMKTAQVTIRQATARPQADPQDLEPFRDKLLPGNLENWTFSVTDAQGNPVDGPLHDRDVRRLDAGHSARTAGHFERSGSGTLRPCISTRPSTDLLLWTRHRSRK